MVNPFAHTGRIDCKSCKENKRYGRASSKLECSSCGGKAYITICLMCENPYPKDCNCYDWMYEEQWFWDIINKKK